ncbi:hypothetical protein [Tessaracoccus flavus]|uniref:Uncharacterized protein n=1 Tax=Tessaracoccus flavus TaxID=1610493 RepID=A0A1Q2CE76_9ACTN|nr:hypothetical protein [Tessaracoccus flavus]AQP44403.1 hypothetical protein RPIT_05890 [Tessaracoccus flavus]SDY68361.1 hypothetical protein SAMN05428934_103126 [Tessaracoccus flavus]
MTTAPLDRTHTQFRRGEAAPLRFRNVLVVEFRKFLATRSNQTLALLTLSSALLVAGLIAAFYDSLFESAANHWLVSAFLIRMPVQYLFAPLIVLLTTSEWGTRSVMTTFTLVPRRGLVIAAKAIVTAVATLLVWGLASALGIASTYLGRDVAGMNTAGMWIPAKDVLLDLLAFCLFMASAFGIGLLVQNSAAAIAIVLVGPMAIQILRQFSEWMSETFAWVDMNGVAQQMQMGGDPGMWPQLLVASVFWVVLPLVGGVWWTFRREAA